MTVKPNYFVSHRITQLGNTTYTHNTLGQRTQKQDVNGITRYNYDVSVNFYRVYLPNLTKIDYLIDPLNRRVGKQVNGVTTAKWLYARSLKQIAELDENNRIRSFFIYVDKATTPSYMIRYNIQGE